MALVPLDNEGVIRKSTPFVTIYDLLLKEEGL